MPAARKAASAWRSDDPSVGGDIVVIGRLLRSVDFERVLRTRSRASSAHFAVHHVAEPPARRLQRASPSDLSTEFGSTVASPVDGLLASPLQGLWLGTVVPKRHARRAVTRNLLKRQIHSVVDGRFGDLADGLWVVRLRAPFDRTLFPSAASEALRQLARAELEQVMGQAAARRPGR